MTNREATVEIDVFGEVTTAAVTPQEVIINYAITPSAINVANSVRDFNIREIEIQLLIDSRMRFYSEILTMTNREATVEITIIAEKVDLSTTHGKFVTVNYFQFADVPIVNFAEEEIQTYSANTLNENPGISFLKRVPGTVYEIDIEPVKSQVVSLFIPTEEHLGNTEREILLYIDSRMRFYSEILTMTNRESTHEIDVIAEGASLIATASMFGGTASGGSSAGSFNLNSSTYAFKRNTGGLITSTSVTFFVSNPSTGALIGAAITGLSTNASGIVTSPVTNASVASGTTYRLNYKFTTGEYGVVELVAA
jgi:hypothetical protein